MSWYSIAFKCCCKRENNSILMGRMYIAGKPILEGFVTSSRCLLEWFCIGLPLSSYLGVLI